MRTASRARVLCPRAPRTLEGRGKRHGPLAAPQAGSYFRVVGLVYVPNLCPNVPKRIGLTRYLVTLVWLRACSDRQGPRTGVAKSDLVAEINEGGRDGSRCCRRRLADSGSGVGADEAAPAGATVASVGLSSAAVPDRDAMNAILLVLRTGMQWNALNATGICSCSSAYRRFREWAEAGVFLEFWRQGLLAYDEAGDRVGVAGDGRRARQGAAGGELTGPNPTDRAKKGRSDRSSPRARASRWGSRRRART